MARDKLGAILVKAGLLDEAGLQRALNEQQRWGGQLGHYLVQLGLVSEENLVRALSAQYKLPAVALDPPKLNAALAQLIPREIAERNRLIAFRIDPQKKFLDVAMADPASFDAMDEVRVATQFNVRPFFAPPSAIDTAINLVYYGDVALGGEVDLSPGSAMRADASELLSRARGGAAAASDGDGTWRPGVTPMSPVQEVPQLEVKVTAQPGGKSPLPPPGPQPPSSRTPPLTESMDQIPLPDPTDDGFHITMEVPSVRGDASARSVEERLERLEALIGRDTAVIELLLAALVRKGVLTREDVDVILKRL